MAKRNRKVNPDIRTAQQRATVRFSPERSTIKALIGDAQARFGADLTAADAGAKSAIQFAGQARKPTVAIFKTARSQADAARSDVEAAFGKLGGAADPFRAATTREQTGAAQRLALARAEALNDLTSRKLEAKAGGQYATNTARAAYRTDVGDLGQRLRDLGDRQGAFVAQEAAAIANARHMQGIPIRVAKINASGRTRAAKVAARAKARENAKAFSNSVKLEGVKQTGRERLAAQGRAKKHRTGLGTNKPASRSELRMFQSDYSKASSFARQFKKENFSRGEARRFLIRGEKGQNPAIGNNLALSVALDMAYDGHLSRANHRAMKGIGVRTRDIGGLVTYTDWYRRNQRMLTSPT
jgi:hypothetical protein